MTHDNKEHVSAGWLDAWHVNPSLSKDYDAIDGLRGIAILMVVFSHAIYYGYTTGPTGQFIAQIAGTGAWGVTVFFTLSGFLIAYPFWKRKIRGSTQVVPTGYGWRRFWKIYPPLALSIILLTPFFYFVLGRGAAVFPNALLWLTGWPLVHPVSDQCNVVMWSLIVEAHFYILLPLLFLAVKRFSVKSSLWIIFLTLFVIPTCYRWWNLYHGIIFQLDPVIHVRFPALMDSFAFGVLLAGLENLQLIKKSWVWLGDIGFVVLAISSVTIAWFMMPTHQVIDPEVQKEIHAWVVKLTSAMMICLIADARHLTSRWLCATWLRWFGIISYEWYLFHQPIVFWMRGIFGPAKGNFIKYSAMIGCSFLVTLLIGAVIYRYFSLPILKYGRGKNKGS